MIQGSKEEQYLQKRWQDQRDYYSKKAKYYKKWHLWLLSISSVGAVLVPIFLNVQVIPTWIPMIISIMVSVALVLDNTFHFGDNWRSFRQTLEALKQERVFFDNEIEPYADPQVAFSLFVQRCEDIMRTEGQTYFERHKPSENIMSGKSQIHSHN